MAESCERSLLSWTIRPMRPEDIPQCLQIWSKVDLTEARQTVASSLASDPDGFFVAELDGQVIGMCAGCMVRADSAFMGFYGVEPKFQGLGVGRQLWRASVKRLEAQGTNIGLYGVPAMADKYKKSGFRVEDTVRMLVFESTRDNELRPEMLKDTRELPAGCRLEEINSNTSERLFAKLVDYDQSVQRFSREKLLRLYLTGDDIPLTLAVVQDASSPKATPEQHQTERKSSCCAKPVEESIIEDETLSSTTKAALSLSSVSVEAPASTGEQCNGQVLGYGCIRLDNNNGGIVGPIYADSSEVCEVILRNLVARFQLPVGGVYSVMALSSNKQASKILAKLGLVEMDQCSRMFTRFVPAAAFANIYYVHSPNFSLF